MLKKTLLLFVSLALSTGFLIAQDDALSQFRFNSEKMDAGNTYAYIIQNNAGDKKMDVYVHLRSETDIDVYVDFSPVAPMVFDIKAVYDKKSFCFSQTDGRNPFSYMKTPNTNERTTLTYNPQAHNVDANVTYFDHSHALKSMIRRCKLDRFPCYEMSLYQIDFWFAMRHYNGNKSSFTVGSFHNGFYTDLIVSYKGEEAINGVLCDKWSLDGKGLLAGLSKARQEVWFRKDDKYVAVMKYKNYQDLPPFGNINMFFQNRESQTNQEWDDFVAQKNEAARTRLGFPENKNRD